MVKSGKTVKYNDEYEWFGCDGDRIHKKCKPNLNKAYDAINNMSDSEFRKYISDKNDKKNVNDINEMKDVNVVMI